jgi:cyclopropane fatty-acyl-phospholipid synthase-like methyltransferase
MITIKTEAPIAYDSDDHIHPDGIYLDNNVTPEFVNDVELYFQRKINFLDLGCAGGALTCELIDRGHNAVGIDGSDHCLNFRQEAADKLSMSKPLGFDNWQKHGNTRLFTADITKDFQLYENGEPMKFDLITAWDVMEHFFPDRIDTFIEQIKKHLTPDGLFVASIAKFSLNKHNVEYHKSNFPQEWWLERLTPHMQRATYPFAHCNRDLTLPYDTNDHLLWCSHL